MFEERKGKLKKKKDNFDGINRKSSVRSENDESFWHQVEFLVFGLNFIEKNKLEKLQSKLFLFFIRLFIVFFICTSVSLTSVSDELVLMNLMFCAVIFDLEFHCKFNNSLCV